MTSSKFIMGGSILVSKYISLCTFLCLTTPVFGQVMDNAEVKSDNEPLAVYRDGQFILPNLRNYDDSYKIEFSFLDGKKTHLQLPAGVHSFSFQKAKQYPANWSWRLLYQAAKTAHLIAIKNPDELKLPYRELIRMDKLLNISWTKIDKASAYEIKIEKEQNVDNKKIWKVDQTLSCDVRCEESELMVLPVKLEDSSQYRYSITATDTDSIIIAQSNTKAITTENPETQGLAGAFKSASLTLQKSKTLNKKEAEDPAFFGYNALTEKGVRDSAYSAEFAFIWAPKTKDSTNQSAYLEARLNSRGLSKPENILRTGYYLEGVLDTKFSPTIWNVGAEYEFDNKTKTKDAFVWGKFTPLLLGLGKYHSLDFGGKDFISIYPQLSGTLELGKKLIQTDDRVDSKNLMRFKTEASVSMRWYWLEDLFNIHSLTSTWSLTSWHMPHQDIKNARISNSILAFGIDKNISLGLSYTVGADAPSFIFKRYTNAGLMLKF